MKIKNISCKRFAGIQNLNISFTDGINVICGKNESGKSTLVNLLSRTLFQEAKLGFQKEKDKEFRKLYLPVSGDFADGEVVFETEKGTYTLEKKWGSKTDCTIYTPQGDSGDQEKINEFLREALIYGEGVYSDILFSSQRNTDISLETILDASKKTETKQDIVDAVSQAFAESNGISVDAIEQAINAKIDEIAGKHWDFDREAPVRRNPRYSNGLGEILKAYYALEDAKKVLEEISTLERNADSAANFYTAKDTATRIAEEMFNKFNAFSNALIMQKERSQTVLHYENDLKEVNEILNVWPELDKALDKARKLECELKNRKTLNKYEKVKKINDAIKEIEDSVLKIPYPDSDEITTVKTATQKVQLLESKLCGMNITAGIKAFGTDNIIITSARTGEGIEITDNTANITEAVIITVPDVIELQLSPANINLSLIEEEIAKQKKIIDDVLKKYNACSLEELETNGKKAVDAKSQLEREKEKLSFELGGIDFSELEENAKSLSNVAVRDMCDIENDIFDVCGSGDVLKYIIAKETIVKGYADKHGSINDLKVKAFDLNAELKKAKVTVTDAKNIPNEFLNITDPETHLEVLRNDLKSKQASREEALTEKATATSKLESYKENISGDPVAKVEKAERVFEETKSLLYHWVHIAKEFKAQKENIHNNPMQDIADSFTCYLGIISGGKIESEFPEADKLNMNIYSDNKLLDYGKLSEGTKETVSLAFRLAVLDHLFPGGGGVIVFDDPFTDMDADRTLQSCELIKECAKKHQVIFLTCREEYTDMLNSNVICLG